MILLCLLIFFFSSENFTAEFSRYLICIRLKALARESEANDCTIRDVLHLIDIDPFNLNVLSANFTDIYDCFGGRLTLSVMNIHAKLHPL